VLSVAGSLTEPSVPGADRTIGVRLVAGSVLELSAWNVNRLDGKPFQKRRDGRWSLDGIKVLLSPTKLVLCMVVGGSWRRGFDRSAMSSFGPNTGPRGPMLYPYPSKSAVIVTVAINT
jgi:hypothetical protein